MRLDAKAFGLACGIVVGIAGFLATLFSLQRGAGQTISVLSAAYFGYTWSFTGALLAIVWGLLYGFIGGWLVAVIYNGLAGRRGP
jgi:hypothetical protein